MACSIRRDVKLCRVVGVEVIPSFIATSETYEFVSARYQTQADFDRRMPGRAKIGYVEIEMKSRQCFPDMPCIDGERGFTLAPRKDGRWFVVSSNSANLPDATDFDLDDW